MQTGARTPEELETLLEDAFVMHDHAAISGLFENHALLSGGNPPLVARGRMEIVDALATMWARNEHYLAAPKRVLQTRGTALIAAERATSVARRSQDGAWRYAIALLQTQTHPRGAEHDQHNNRNAGAHSPR